jgi:hypothetical protein
MSFIISVPHIRIILKWTEEYLIIVFRNSTSLKDPGFTFQPGYHELWPRFSWLFISSTFRQIPRWHFKLGHERFPLHSFLFTTRQWSNHSTLYNLSYNSTDKYLTEIKCVREKQDERTWAWRTTDDEKIHMKCIMEDRDLGAGNWESSMLWEL